MQMYKKVAYKCMTSHLRCTRNAASFCSLYRFNAKCLHSALFICTALIFNSLSSVDTIYTRLHFLYTHLHFSTRVCTFSTHHKKNVMPFATTTPFYGHGRQPCLLREAEFSVAPTQKSPSLYNRKQMLSPHLRHSPDKQCITCQWLLHAAKWKIVQCRQ